MHLYIIRHAQSANNAKPIHQRVEDPPITSVGQLQAKQLAAWAKTLRIDALITSPFRRTLQTTKHIVDIQPRSVEVWHDVYECGGCFRGYGDNTSGGIGLGRTAIAETLGMPESKTIETQENCECTIDKTIDESGWWGEQDRETDEHARSRAKQVVDRLVETYATASTKPLNVVLVTHADFKRLMLAAILPDVISPRRIGPLRNAGISRLNLQDQRWELDWLNSVTHLPNKLITGSEY